MTDNVTYAVSRLRLVNCRIRALDLNPATIPHTIAACVQTFARLELPKVGIGDILAININHPDIQVIDHSTFPDLLGKGQVISYHDIAMKCVTLIATTAAVIVVFARVQP